MTEKNPPCVAEAKRHRDGLCEERDEFAAMDERLDLCMGEQNYEIEVERLRAELADAREQIKHLDGVLKELYDFEVLHSLRQRLHDQQVREGLEEIERAATMGDDLDAIRETARTTLEKLGGLPNSNLISFSTEDAQFARRIIMDYMTLNDDMRLVSDERCKDWLDRNGERIVVTDLRRRQR